MVKKMVRGKDEREKKNTPQRQCGNEPHTGSGVDKSR